MADSSSRLASVFGSASAGKAYNSARKRVAQSARNQATLPF